MIKTTAVSGLMMSVSMLAAAANIESPKVTIEQKFDVSAEKAWGKLGRFCGISDWQSLVASCLVEERKDGIYRVVVMRNDSAFTERLETFSQADRSFSYSILSGPLPVTGYRSELKIEPAGQQSKLIWRAWYTVPKNGDAVKIKQDLESLFGNGIKGMLSLLGSK